MFSSITGLLGQFMGPNGITGLLGQFIDLAASLVYKVSSRVQKHHWFTRSVHGLSSITSLQGQF